MDVLRLSKDGKPKSTEGKWDVFTVGKGVKCEVKV